MNDEENVKKQNAKAASFCNIMASAMRGAPLALMALVLCFSAATHAAFYVPVNRSEVVTTAAELSEVIVADPEIADIFVHGRNTISVIGRSVGITTVRLLGENGKEIRKIDVHVTYDLPAIRRALNEFLPHEAIGVEMINARVALTGDISSAEAAMSAVQIASQFITTPRQAGLPSAEEESPIINLMRVRSGQQVMLRIRFGEISRSTVKALGASLNINKTSGDLGLNILSPSVAATAGNAALRSIAGTYDFTSSTSVTAALEALERDSLIKILAEPNLVTLSGETAEFLSGGEVPIPVTAQDGQVQVEFKPFGVSLRFTPFVLSENRIRIQVQPEVSTRNDAAGVPISVGGVLVPAFDVRRASTTVELAPGESFMIAGLLEDTLGSTVDQVPGINEIPIFSALFRSTAYQRDETELVIAVTPYLVDPLKSSDVRLPTDNFRPASLMEGFLYGALSSIQGNVRRISQMPTMEGPIGFMVD
jgi:pilus assembly protein CpaC